MSAVGARACAQLCMRAKVATRTFLPFSSASVRSPTDFLAISTVHERATRDCDSFDTGAVYDVAEIMAAEIMVACEGCGLKEAVSSWEVGEGESSRAATLAPRAG